MDSIINAMARQGDVLIRRVESIPASAEPIARDQDRVVLAYGEVTGHAHALHGARAALFMDKGGFGGRRYLRITGEPEPLTHEEHSTILIAPGDYEVVQQREYSPEAIRNVAD